MTGQGPRESNERLEFLGDSVLGLVTSESLYRQHPNEHEGQLTKTKSLLVSKAILSRRALAMGLGRFVLMSHSEIESGGRQRLSILADAFESVIGAIYLDQGFEAARTFIHRWLLRDAPEIVADKRHTNYKSHLQEYVQSTFRTHPVYRIRSEMGPDHSKHFMVEVLVGRRALGEGKGHNKKEAEQAAARDALDRVGNERGEKPAREGSERESREREPRVRDSREGRLASAAPVVESQAGVVTEDENEEMRRRRRRGRRGGRGRRARGDDAPMVESPEPVVERAPVASPVERPAPARAPVVARPRTIELPEVEPREIEPVPSAYEEDELEEVGRPEGPIEERHIDPYAIELSPREEELAQPHALPDMPEPEPPRFEDAKEELPGSESLDDVHEDSPAREPAPPAPRETPPAIAKPATGAYGRRPGRARRAPRND